MCDLDEKGGKETVGLIETSGCRASFLHTDVASAADVERAVDALMETYGGLHFALNNAGTFTTSPRERGLL